MAASKRTAAAVTGWTDRPDMPLVRIHLDPVNPRHDPIDNEDEIIAHLYRTEKVLGMAKSIAELGSISPLDRIGVVEMVDNPGHFIAVEGNRRACALRLLHDPRKAPTAAARAEVEKLAKGVHLGNTIPVVVFRDRPTSKPYVGLRHNGAQAGAGIRTWNSTQKARHDQDANPNQLALAILDRAQSAKWIDLNERKQIGLTTLTRYLKSKLVRSVLGLSATRELEFSHDPKEVDACLRHFVRDALPVGKADPVVNSRTNSAQREAYAKSLVSAGVAPKTLLRTPTSPPPTARVAAKARARSRQNPATRPRVLSADFVVQHRDSALLRVVAELRGIETDDHEFSVNYLIRAIVERVLALYAIENGFFKSGMPDHVLVQKCHEHLKASGVSDNQLKNMRTAAWSQDVVHSLHTLGAAVHGGHVPVLKQLNAVWDTWQPALQIVLDRLPK